MPDREQDPIAGRYRLGDRLGQGGSGVVWRAQDLLLRREVAMKELLPPVGIEEQDLLRLQQGVLREARAAARLHHPGAVAVYDVVEEGRRQFIVMELVDAADLSHVVAAGGPLSPPRTAGIGLELLEVLQAANRSGIIHRDVKPGNVLVPTVGRCRLGDFGIAAMIDDPRITATGMIKGTPSYMSPEQAMAGTIGAATDLWSLGATMYFAVEGHPPFDKGQPIATLAAIALEEPQPFVRAASLGPVLRSLLAKDPAQRPDHETLRRSLQMVVASDGQTVSDGRKASSSEGQTVSDCPGVPAAAAVAAVVSENMASPTERMAVRPPEPPSSGPGALVASPIDEAPPRPGPIDPGPPITTRSPEVLVPAGPPVAQEGLAALTPSGASGRARVPRTGPKHRVARSDLPRRRAMWAVGMGVTAVVVTGVVIGASRSTGSRSHSSASPANPVLPVPAGSHLTTTSPPSPSRPPVAAAVVTTTPVPVPVPAGWKAYADPDTGFALAYPPTWNVVRQGTLTDFRDPASGTYIRVDHQSPPAVTPDGPWYALEPGFAAKNGDYRRIGISRTTFHGYSAAIWEYTYLSGTRRLHAIDLGLIAGDHGFALNFQTDDASWTQMQSVLTNLENSFQP